MRHRLMLRAEALLCFAVREASQLPWFTLRTSSSSNYNPKAPNSKKISYEVKWTRVVFQLWTSILTLIFLELGIRCTDKSGVNDVVIFYSLEWRRQAAKPLPVDILVDYLPRGWRRLLQPPFRGFYPPCPSILPVLLPPSSRFRASDFRNH